ncbi:MAG: hypothetical protein Q7O04_05890 [Candidatus Omnitrophota bacterium]|nr:hypothetical protein [Candidatus Omnitrophota bacterium]
MMSKETLYFHFANLGLVIIGIFSVQKIVGPVIVALLVLGTIVGFLFSWYARSFRPPHIDTFIGMLSLASVVVVLSRLYETEMSFENLLRIFSVALVWLGLFQSFGLSTQKNYSLTQFISAALLISSVGLALEQETVYILYLAVFLFILIFTMRLALVCEKQNLGSMIIGDKEEVMSLWQQIKVGAIMFSVIMILSALVYPAVPRFNNLSLKWVPSTLIGIPEEVPILKLLFSADKTIKDVKVKKEQIVDDGSKKRETDSPLNSKKDEKKDKTDITERFKPSDYNKNIDSFKVESLTIKSDKLETPLDRQVSITAELKLTDGSVIPATRLVDWKVTGNTNVSLDKNGNLSAESEGDIQISASYLGVFSNDVKIKIKGPVEPKKKKSFLFYVIVTFLWVITAAVAISTALVFIRARRLSELCKTDPKEFIKEVYYALCGAFKIYGVPKFSYVAYREYYDLLKELVSLKPETMKSLTEGFMEARFSGHEISQAHSQKAIELFHEVKDVVLEKEGRDKFWKDILFRLCVLDISLIQK